MNLPVALAEKGLMLADVSETDLQDYIHVKKECFKQYVDEYFGGWVDEVQREKNAKGFRDMLTRTCFKKIVHEHIIVGFFTYNEQEDKIDGVTIQLLESVRNMGIGSFCLKHLTALSAETRKPVFLRVFRSNPARRLYMRFGFVVYDQTASHDLMRYDPEIPT